MRPCGRAAGRRRPAHARASAACRRVCPFTRGAAEGASHPMGVWLPPPVIGKVPTSDSPRGGGRVLPGWPGVPRPDPRRTTTMSRLPARVLAAGAAALALTLVGAAPALAAAPTPAPSPVPSPGAARAQQATPTERAAAEVRPAGVGGGAALAAGLAVLLVVLVRRRRRPSAMLPVGLPATPFPGYGPISPQAQPVRAEKVLVHRPWPGVAPTDRTVDPRPALWFVSGPAGRRAPR